MSAGIGICTMRFHDPQGAKMCATAQVQSAVFGVTQFGGASA